MIKAVPQTYAGVRFRSTLEADWAATLDWLKIPWQYEPEAVQLPSGVLYRPDFYLPQIRTWLEVKGPHGERLDKTIELAEAVRHHPNCFRPDGDEDCGCFWSPWQLVVIGHAPIRELTTFTVASDGYDAFGQLATCDTCGAAFFYGIQSYECRACGRGDGDHHLRPCDETFRRVVRGQRGA